MKSQRQRVVISSPQDMHARTEAPPAQDEQKQYWDNRWDRIKDEYPHAWARQRGDAILAMLRSLSLGHPRILDMGCGTGWFTEELAGIG
jgi:2-polyprenyl-3-methyl-5-hydroxy-6-metoxy-1,4-benzoquinol methylase